MNTIVRAGVVGMGSCMVVSTLPCPGETHGKASCMNLLSRRQWPSAEKGMRIARLDAMTGTGKFKLACLEMFRMP